MGVHTLVSGGQTGADRAAFDVGLQHGLRVRGWVPQGRWAEDGPVPERYPNLIETESRDPAERTARNVRDSEGTLLLSHGPLFGGSLLTAKKASEIGRPLLHLDLDRLSLDQALQQLRPWLAEQGIQSLNIAGPRASDDPAIYDATHRLLEALFAAVRPRLG